MSERATPRPDWALPDSAALGFSGSEETGWVRATRGREIRFRILRTLAELAQAERLHGSLLGSIPAEKNREPVTAGDNPLIKPPFSCGI